MVKHTSLGHLKFWPLWAVDDKLISILDFIGHRVIFLYQVKGQCGIYSLGVITYWIRISQEVANFLCVCHSYFTMDTFIFSIGIISGIWELFPLMNALHVDWLSRRHKFSSIPASVAADRMVSPTCIILASPFLTLLFIDSVYWTY